MDSVKSGPRLAVIAGALLALFTVPSALVSAGGMTDVQSCGGGEKTNLPLERFSLSAANDLWREFPAMRRAPELETDTAPARVIVFRDGYDAAAAAVFGNIGPRPAGLDTVVCVIQADGTRTVYTNVSRQGSRFDH